ncbi:MAG TPA: glycosyltransferase, partial [Pseudonocardiaceae bacterium]|nr:glycosyltransferase [Pseudonocardiaceae bacterium]
ASNDGFAAGVNAGLTAASGCDVLVLNPDIRLDPGSVAALRESLLRPGTGITGITVPRLLDAEGQVHPSLRRRPSVPRAFAAALLGGTRAGRVPALGELIIDPAPYLRGGVAAWATGAAWLISADCIAMVGHLDERYFLYSEETEYMLRAADHGFVVRLAPAAVAIHLGGAQTRSPSLWALSVTNQVRLHRERRGMAAAGAMWLALVLSETLRLIAHRHAGRRRHLAALAALARMRRWPQRPTAGAEPVMARPGYLCFSAQDWWYHNRAHSDFQLMREIARHRRVLVVNSIGLRMPLPGRSTHVARRILRKLRSVAKLVRRPVPGLPEYYVMSPLPLPLYHIRGLRALSAILVRAQVRAVCLALGMRAPVIITTMPTAWDVVRPMRRHSLMYNRSDRHSEFPEADRATIEGLERELLCSADRVLYASRSLLASERALTGERAHFLDHGVDIGHFRRRDAAELPADLARIPEPRVGFFGALDGFLVDFGLLERVAAELPEVSLVLIGDATHPMDRFEKYPNVHWLGFRPYEQIPAYGSGFAVGIMPWLDNPWIAHANPIKLKEYLALGLPVVSTPFAEIAHYADRVSVAAPADFVAAIRSALAGGGAGTPQSRRDSVLGASWVARSAELIELAEGQQPSDSKPVRP